MAIRGLRYPFEVANGDLVVEVEYPEQVRQAIVHSVATIKGELVWLPRYGRDIQAFESATDIASLLARLRSSIAQGLQGYPQVTFSLLGAFSSESELTVVVTYQVPNVEQGSLQLTLDI